MIRLTPTGALSWSFDIARAGVHIGTLELARFKRGGSMMIEGRRYELKRERLFGPLALLSDGRIIARADRVAGFRPRYRINADDRQVELRGDILLHRAVITHGDVVVATMRRPKFFRRILEIELAQSAPLPLILFATAVIVFYWRAASRSAK